MPAFGSVRFLLKRQSAANTGSGTLEEEMHSRSRIAEVILWCEVHMQFIGGSTVKSEADVISSILNCVCPECGGRMGERGKECLKNWRQTWEQASADLGVDRRS